MEWYVSHGNTLSHHEFESLATRAIDKSRRGKISSKRRDEILAEFGIRWMEFSRRRSECTDDSDETILSRER